MKTILVLLFPIILIGCSNSLSDKEVDAMLDKAANPPSQEVVCIGCDSTVYAALVKMVNQKLKSEVVHDSIPHSGVVICDIKKEIKRLNEMSAGLFRMANERRKFNKQIDQINKALDNILAGQNWKINRPNKNDSGIVLPGMVYSITDMPITTGGSSIAIGRSAINGGITITDKDSFDLNYPIYIGDSSKIKQ